MRIPILSNLRDRQIEKQRLAIFRQREQEQLRMAEEALRAKLAAGRYRSRLVILGAFAAAFGITAAYLVFSPAAAPTPPPPVTPTIVTPALQMPKSPAAAAFTSRVEDVVVRTPPKPTQHFTCGPGTVWVKEHTRKNGTRVSSYCRSAPSQR